MRRVLDVEGQKLCFVIGTTYTEMALKPNVLEDLAREVSTTSAFSSNPTFARSHVRRPVTQNYVAAPPPRRKFCSSTDEVMLEDESGRVRLTGRAITDAAGTFVTGQFATGSAREPTLGALVPIH